MAITVLRILTFYIVAWLEVDRGLRPFIKNVKRVDQMLKRIELRLNAVTEDMIGKYENDDELLREMSVNQHVNPVLNMILKDIDDARANGKNVQHCHDRVFTRSIEVSNREFKKIIPCLNEFHAEYQLNMKDITDLTLAVKSTRKTLNNAEQDCRENEDVINCVHTKAMEASWLREDYQQKAILLEYSISVNNAKAFNNTINCMSVGESALKNAMNVITKIAAKCLRT